MRGSLQPGGFASALATSLQEFVCLFSSGDVASTCSPRVVLLFSARVTSFAITWSPFLSGVEGFSSVVFTGDIVFAFYFVERDSGLVDVLGRLVPP